MNTAAKTFTVAIACIAAATALGLAHRSAAPATEIVKLERVVIVAKRADVVAQLPRVVIEGRRAALADATVAAAQAPAWIA